MISLKHWPAISLAAGIMAVAIVVAFTYCRHEPTPLPKAEAKTADSLNVTAPIYRAHVDTLRQIDSTATRQARAFARSAAIANRTADSLRLVAIAAEERAKAATTSDSQAVAWHAASDRYKAEANQRLASYDSLHNAYVDDSIAHVSATNRADAAEAREIALAGFSDRLQRDLARADPPCRIAILLHCPSRKVVAIAAAATGYAVSRSDVRSAARKVVTAPFSLLTK